jgi:predicted AAA+ superfamily ATPase
MVLKILHDEFPHLKVIATGSSSFELSNMINEPLTGRKITYSLYPLTYRELTSTDSTVIARRKMERMLRFGSYPSVILNDDQKAFENLNEIVSSYLFKDIFAYQHLKKPDVLTNLLRLLAFQVASEVSFTEIANKLRVDQTVVQRYIQLLEDGFIIFRLKAFKRNLRNEIGKSRKIYFWDTGVRNMLVQNLNPIHLRDDIGALWENYCISERHKLLNYNIPQTTQTYFWRTYHQKEIDLIEEKENHLKAFEFKWNPEKKVKFPSDFQKAYPGTELKIIHPDNFEKEIYRL